MTKPDNSRLRLEALLVRTLAAFPDTPEGRASGYKRFSEALLPAVEKASSQGLQDYAEKLEGMAASVIVAHEESARRAEIDSLDDPKSVTGGKSKVDPVMADLPAGDPAFDPVIDQASTRTDDREPTRDEDDGSPAADPQPVSAPLEKPRRGSRKFPAARLKAGKGFAAGFAAGAIVAGIAAAAAWALAPASPPLESAIIMAEDREAAEPAVSIARDLLQDVADRIVSTGLPETAALLGGPGFRNLPKEFAEILSGKTPKVRRLLPVRIRVDGAGYKVLVTSDICPLVVAEYPDLLDMRRARFGSLCSSFSVSNEAGRNF